jgi:hypothetical protein
MPLDIIRQAWEPAQPNLRVSMCLWVMAPQLEEESLA